MKIALLFSGYIGSIQKKNSKNSIDLRYKEQDIFLKICYNHWYKHLLSKENVDIYVHSWDKNYEDLIIKYFKPVVIKTEIGLENSELYDTFRNKITNNGIRLTNNGRINQIYSYKKVWEIFEPYSSDYDIIIHARFSMCLHRPFPLDKLKPNTIYTTKLLNGTQGPYEHYKHGFFEDPIISTSVSGSREYCDAINYLLDKDKYKLWKKHEGHFNNSLNCVSAHRTTYHILHILKKYYNIFWDWIPDFIYTNHYHSSSFNFCRHLYFGHLDFNHRRGSDPMFDNIEQRETLQIPENIDLIKNHFTLK